MTRKKTLLWAACGCLAAIFPICLYAFIKGPDPRYTAAPGDSPLACASAGCHTGLKSGGPINAFAGSVTAFFSSGCTYTPGGGPISVTVRVSDPVNSLYGFQMTARLDSNQVNGQAGTFTAGPGTFVMCESGQPRRPNSSCPASAPVEFIEHSDPSRNPFTFSWTPPATNLGPVHFYVAGNAVNNNQTEDAGDHVYTAKIDLNPAAACSANTPAIAAAVSASQFGQAKNFGSGGWLEIYGKDFSINTVGWAGCDFDGANAPTVLDRVKVLINNKPAYVDFISPGQVNVNAPDDNATGPVQIALSNCDKTSAPFIIQKDTLVPGLLAFPSNGKDYLFATSLSGTTVGNPGNPVKPGDIIVAYGIGFGGTTPSFGPGIVVGGLNTLANPLKVLFGQTQLAASDIVYAGLGPGFVGLYQFNLRVPNLADGDTPLTFTVGATTVAQTLNLSVKR